VPEHGDGRADGSRVLASDYNGICKDRVALLSRVHCDLRGGCCGGVDCKFRDAARIEGRRANSKQQFLPETKGIPLEEMARMFGDEVVVTLEDVSVNRDTHELVVGGEGKDGLRHVATHQGITPEVERAIKEEHDRMEKGEMVHREDVGKVA
jgi:hypothetical protein